ncbi:MAG: DUF1501 domain-containing protein [Planctomycetaceae bacterium]|nr:DUF1501 domain-containing protein [Planctomycetaceae bacterium]
MFSIRTTTANLTRTWSRRDALQLGLGGALTAALPGGGLLHAANAGSGNSQPGFGKAKSAIYIYLYGGPSHLDVWDLKPEAPAEVRGEFQPIDTNVPGIQICEHLPQLARRMDQLAIIRSLTHDGSGHGSSAHRMLTGQPSSKEGEVAPTVVDAPHPGSVLSQLARAQRATTVPGAVSLPWEIATQINVIPGQTAGWLGQQFDPVRIQYQDQQGQNFQLTEPGALAAAMKLDQETDATRERYGRNVFGQSLLLARRMVEAGVRVVTVYWPDRRDEKALNYNGKRQPVSVPMWDTHGSGTGDTANFPSLKNRLLPPLDMASAALMDDLADRNRLDETLLLWAGEFGRTPRIHGDGRSHYAKCFSAMLAGGGIQGGRVHGRSDATGSAPLSDPVSPADFVATAYHLLGVPGDLTLPGPDGMPRKVITGRPGGNLLG